jgi:hypothetical protein
MTPEQAEDPEKMRTKFFKKPWKVWTHYWRQMKNMNIAPIDERLLEPIVLESLVALLRCPSVREISRYFRHLKQLLCLRLSGTTRMKLDSSKPNSNANCIALNGMMLSFAVKELRLRLDNKAARREHLTWHAMYVQEYEQALEAGAGDELSHPFYRNDRQPAVTSALRNLMKLSASNLMPRLNATVWMEAGVKSSRPLLWVTKASCSNSDA